jgi:hypothetical protein
VRSPLGSGAIPASPRSFDFTEGRKDSRDGSVRSFASTRSNRPDDGPPDVGPIVGTSPRAGTLRGADSRDHGRRPIVPHASGIRQDTGAPREETFVRATRRHQSVRPIASIVEQSNQYSRALPASGRRRAHRPPFHRPSSMNVRGASAAGHSSGPPTRRRSLLPPHGRTGGARHRSMYLRFKIS